MRATPFLALCLLTTYAIAQTPSAPGARPGGDPLDKAKTAVYYLRYADEVRAKKQMEQTRTALTTHKYGQALAREATINLDATWGRFVTAGGTPFVAVQVALPDGTKPGTALTFFGQLLDDDGRVLTDFEVPATALESKGDVFVEHSLLAAEGVAARFGVAKGDQILGVSKSELATVHDTNPAAREISQLIVSNNVFNMTEAQKPFEPFAFGGTKVVPKPNRAFHPADEAWLFVELREQDPKAPLPAVSIRAAVEGEGRKIAGVWQTAEVLPLKGVAGHYGVGTTVDLSSLRPGEYRVTLSVRDEAAKETIERVQTISIR
jgi:hypothetical protein